MKDFTRSYKYDCRTCLIRQRCIDSKGFGPGLKMSIARRFENNTDTFETWDVLQQDCLLERRDKLKTERQPHQESSLLKRLRQARQPPTKPAPAQPKPTAFRTIREPAAVAPPAPQAQVKPTTKTSCGLIVIATQRMVRLPDDGDIVLGRSERGFSNPPDVDLAFDDGMIPSVSRRHALIIGRRGQHWIEDMGSANGTYLNGYPLSLGDSTILNPGDRILLGRCRLAHTPLPEWSLEPDQSVPHTAALVITHIGQQIELSNEREIIIGRPDPTLGYIPDVDLSIADDIATHVSRRHTRLIARDGWHFLEDVGSAAGTWLNGRRIRVGDSAVLLHPGDQIKLGGCIVAYEWKLL